MGEAASGLAFAFSLKMTGWPMKNRVYVIAEIGINHNGSLDNCFRLIDAAKAAGCDCVKFQFFSAKKLYPVSAGSLRWKNASKSYSYPIYNKAEEFELPRAWIRDIISYCLRAPIGFFSSVFDPGGADFLVNRGMRMIKISSYALTNLPLIEHCAAFRLPMVMSTGGAKLGEVEDAVSAASLHGSLITLLQCSLKYPTAPDECNLGIIQTLMRAFPEARVGLSDHTALVSRAAVQAVYLGARVIEKHITLDKTMPGPDHFYALEPASLKRLVLDVRRAEEAAAKGAFTIDPVLFGATARTVYPHERYLRDFAFMKMFACRPIKKGARIRCSDICILRPGNKEHGLDPKYLRLFRKYRITAKKAVNAEEPITWDLIVQ